MENSLECVEAKKTIFKKINVSFIYQDRKWTINEMLILFGIVSLTLSVWIF